MVLAKIHVTNEEEDSYFELDVYCPKIKDVKKVEKILEDFKNIRENRFWGSSEYIKELEKNGYSASEVEYVIEI